MEKQQIFERLANFAISQSGTYVHKYKETTPLELDTTAQDKEFVAVVDLGITEEIVIKNAGDARIILHNSIQNGVYSSQLTDFIVIIPGESRRLQSDLQGILQVI